MPFFIGRFLLQIGKIRQFYWSIEKSTMELTDFERFVAKICQWKTALAIWLHRAIYVLNTIPSHQFVGVITCGLLCH